MSASWKLRARVALSMALVLCTVAGCGNYNSDGQEEGGSPADAPAIGTLEPRHGGRIVELTGSYDAELVIMEGGMSFVYLYDDAGSPVPYEGKAVQLSVATPDGKSQTLDLEGMGSGAGAHFMNPLSQEMTDGILAAETYRAEIRVTTPEGEQTGQLEIQIGE